MTCSVSSYTREAKEKNREKRIKINDKKITPFVLAWMGWKQHHVPGIVVMTIYELNLSPWHQFEIVSLLSWNQMLNWWVPLFLKSSYLSIIHCYGCYVVGLLLHHLFAEDSRPNNYKWFKVLCKCLDFIKDEFTTDVHGL